MSAAERKRLWKAANPDKTAEYSRRQRAANPAKYDAAQRRSRYRLLYGISLEQYEAMARQQGGVCKLCGHPPKKRRLYVDHDHRTKRVRGLLCFRCNRALPDYITDSVWFRRAYEYLIDAYDGRKL